MRPFTSNRLTSHLAIATDFYNPQKYPHLWRATRQFSYRHEVLCVISPPKHHRFLERVIRQFLSHCHRDLSGSRYCSTSPLRQQITDLYVVILCRRLLDIIDRYLAILYREKNPKPALLVQSKFGCQ